MEYPEIIKLEVTEEDIGTPGKWVGKRCMLDRALDRKFGPEVFDTSISSVYRRSDHASYNMDDKTYSNVRDWDTSQPVEPFTAVLRRKS